MDGEGKEVGIGTPNVDSEYRRCMNNAIAGKIEGMGGRWQSRAREGFRIGQMSYPQQKKNE